MMYIMPVLIGLALLLGVLINKPSPVVAQQQRVETTVSAYRLFMMATDTYFNANPAPAVTTAYTWATLKAGAPPTQQGAGMPPFWKAVRSPDGEWVACTELDEPTLAAVGRFYPEQKTTVGSVDVPLVVAPVPAASVPTVVGTGGASIASGIPIYVVLGQTGATSAASANLCSNY